LQSLVTKFEQAVLERLEQLQPVQFGLPRHGLANGLWDRFLPFLLSCERCRHMWTP
jgi:hypothetical protein